MQQLTEPRPQGAFVGHASRPVQRAERVFGAWSGLSNAFFSIVLVAVIGIGVASAQPHGEKAAAPAEKAAPHGEPAPASGEKAAPHGEKAAPHGAEPATAHAPESGAEHAPPGTGMEAWKWANFLLLAAGLGYLIGKNAGPFFDARTRQIRKDMDDSASARKAAEASAAEVERRLANLEAEIASLRAESTREAEAETARLAEQTAAEIAKIQVHAEQEIVSAGKLARMELKRYSAELAVDLAEQKIRARMTPDTQDDLVQSFVHNLK